MATSFYFFKSRFISLVLVMLLTQSLFAQGTGALRGRVFDKTTNEPLTGANVIVLQTSLGSASDLDGNYLIRGIPAGNRSIKVSYIGYNPITVDIEIFQNRTLEQDFYLDARTLTGETVVITAQAEGQLSAINQQLTSNTIANVVSKARIKELPDVNAAESIGRLPGISIQRYGGEATKVEIRGLSPKYNTVTVNGVRLPGTGGDDRSVDLSLISSNMLDGISVKKANTPDMDADALGGTVDLKLREAPDQFEANVSAQGGYNKLQNYYGNYNFNASVSNRFFGGKLGVIASLNADDYDRSADKFSAGYNQEKEAITNITRIKVNSLNLREEKVTRGRNGASLLLDYRIPLGKVTANTFYNKLNSDALIRVNRSDISQNRHYYDLEDRGGNTSIFTGAIGIEQDFNWIKYDLTASRTASRLNNPDEKVWNFVQENTSFNTGAITPDTQPNEILTKYATVDTIKTALQDLFVYETKLNENESALQLNVQVPFNLGSQINGYIKAGGKLRWQNRYYDRERTGRNGLNYGGSAGVSALMTNLLKYTSQRYPDQWNWKNDSTLVRNNGWLPISRMLSDYSRSDFLAGEYPLGFAIDERLANQLTEALYATGQNIRYAIESIGNDYDGIERYQAGYLMGEVNFTKYITFIPGFRYEKDYSKYHGQSFKRSTPNNIEGPPADLRYLEVERNNEFWLPMFHLIANPFDWMKIRLARTETITRPDFIRYAPITYINEYGTYINAANSELKPAHSINYDASISVYENYVGLFTVSGFQKSIKDIVFQVTYYLKTGIKPLPGLNLLDKWYGPGIGAPQLDTYINNPEPAKYKGIELDWQTNFWYLPEPFNGLVLSANYTFIDSEISKQVFFNTQGEIIPNTRPPRREELLADSLRIARMPDQPKHIVNITLGYDYKGFSTRLSYLYQTDKVTYISNEPILDNFTGAYARWDLSLQQKLDFGLQIYVNLTNLNNRADRNFRGSALNNPTYIEYYGFSMDVGIRYKL